MSENQTRRRVTYYTQLLHLWESLNKHREIAVGYNKSAQAREHSKRMWEKIASLLNSFGEGSVKSGSEWSKYWVDYKAKIKRKNRLINEAARRTGGGPSTDLELSEIDRKFLSILGEDYGLGLPGIQVDPLVSQEHLDSRLGTSQSISTDEGPLYLEVDFHENENQQREGEGIPSSFSQTSSHQEQIAQVQDDSQSNSAPTQARVSGHQCASTSAQLATQSSTSQQANTQQTPRRRQRGRRRLTAADAREQLVAAAQSRAQAELANSHSLQQAIGILGDMVSILRRIETK